MQFFFFHKIKIVIRSIAFRGKFTKQCNAVQSSPDAIHFNADRIHRARNQNSFHRVICVYIFSSPHFVRGYSSNAKPLVIGCSLFHSLFGYFSCVFIRLSISLSSYLLQAKNIYFFSWFCVCVLYVVLSCVLSYFFLFSFHGMHACC